ncbi:hypothetical protein BDV36DRAFT_141512 [Aspergillus pseudocaelatus]|uniref:Uncharacterized protein n=1 Tax=Aspergillus pseudocaelatus TaxID=1825620 RepID=A0ABQ6WQ18_9EURO|nr:hypothetical protein BDV36DRAFT_141512 [Aspergillus pseudocaelatus]
MDFFPYVTVGAEVRCVFVRAKFPTKCIAAPLTEIIFAPIDPDRLVTPELKHEGLVCLAENWSIIHLPFFLFFFFSPSPIASLPTKLILLLLLGLSCIYSGLQFLGIHHHTEYIIPHFC